MFLALGGIRSVGEEPLVDLVETLGGWPVVAGTNWKGSTSVEVLLGQVRSRLNMGIILELWIGPDDTNSSNNIIQVMRQMVKYVPTS
jgi:membrane metallo-endopeptidase-like protein 1